MNEEFEQLLITCLDALDAGESIDEILARYPAEADALRPLLAAAVALPSLGLMPAPAVQANARRTFLNRAAEMRPMTRAWLPQFARLAASFAIAAALLFGAGVTAAEEALPGDTLYGLKRTVEGVRLSLTGSRAELEGEFANRRRAEIATLLTDGRSVDVRFDGVIESIADPIWRVSGIDVTVSASTVISGGPRVGSRVTVSGRTANGQLMALTITLAPGELPPPTMTATATPSHTATSSPTRTATPTRTPSPSATATLAPSATTPPTPSPIPPTRVPTATPEPTAIPIPTATAEPTATPVPTVSDDNSNDNSEDNSNDNSDDNSNDNGGDDNSNDNSNDNSDDSSDNSDDDNSNDNSDDDSNHNSDDSSINNDNSDDNSGQGGGGGDED